MSGNDKIEIELLPEERTLLLRWTFPFDDVESQLTSFRSSNAIERLTISPYYLGLLISDLSHAVTKRGCRDAAVFELCDRLEFIERTGDGELDY